MAAIPVGAVEPRRGCESGGSGNNYFGSAAAFAVSLKLDSSHRGSGAGLKGRVQRIKRSLGGVWA